MGTAASDELPDLATHDSLMLIATIGASWLVSLFTIAACNIWAERRQIADATNRPMTLKFLAIAAIFGLIGCAAFLGATATTLSLKSTFASPAPVAMIRQLGKIGGFVFIWMSFILLQVVTNAWRLAADLPTRRIEYFRSAVQVNKAQSAGASSGEADAVVIRGAGDPAPWFAAMEYYLLMWNRTYKVFVTSQGLLGAKVRGAVMNPSSATSKMFDQAYWVNTGLSQIYSQLELASDAFLKVNTANFRVLWTEVTAIDYLPGRKWGMGNVPHSGRLVIRLNSGQQRDLILLGQQDGKALKHWLDGCIQR